MLTAGRLFKNVLSLPLFVYVPRDMDVKGVLVRYTAKTVVLTGVHRGPHQAFYTGVKFLVLAQHPVVLF